MDYPYDSFFCAFSIKWYYDGISPKINVLSFFKAYLIQNEVLHRNLQAANVLLDKNETVKVTHLKRNLTKK